MNDSLSGTRRQIKLTMLIFLGIMSVFFLILFGMKHSGVIQLRLGLKKPSELIFEGCQRVMSQQGCSIENGPSEFPSRVKQIFVSGYGTVDAENYKKLKALGPKMCESIRASCEADAQSEPCRIGHALYFGN